MVIKWQLLVAAIYVLLFLTACQVMPAGNRELNITEFSFSSMRAKNFDLLLAENNVSPTDKLHVYIEGDGTPWVNRYFIAKDPGPYGRLALDLMRQDYSSSLYLGRPCYYSWRLPVQENCSPLLWTDARYSETVVDNMVFALKKYLTTHSFNNVILIGHSGGGTLAYLISQRIEQVSAVIIISGNLDTNAWTAHHNYTSLRGSINPAILPDIKHIPLTYLTGDKDNVVPLQLNKSFLQKNQAKIITRPDYDHVCCWRNEWRTLIRDLTANL